MNSVKYLADTKIAISKKNSKGGKTMTMSPKELLYLEDSMSMEQQLHTKCNDYASKVTDPQLQNMLNKLAMDHQKRFSSLMSQLNG